MGNRNVRDIVFLGLAVAFLLAAIFLVKRPTIPSSPVPAPTPTEVKAPVTSAPTPQQAEKALLAEGKTPAKPTVNPFSTPVKVKLDPSELPANPAGQPAVTPSPTVAPAATTVAATPATTATATVLPPLTTASATPAPKPVTPEFKGIMGGASTNPTAFIRYGNKRYYVKQGEKFAGQYRVESVSYRQVVLVSTQGKLTLKMGGS